MKFLCVGYYSPARMDALPRARIDAIMGECAPHMDVFHRTGRVALVAGTGQDTKCLQRTGGRVEVADGPGPGRPEAIGCVFILEAADMAEAIRVASLHPTTQIPAGEQLGWRIEIHPVHFYEQRPVTAEKGRD